MSETMSNSNAVENEPPDTETQESNETEQNETINETVELPSDRMEQGPNNAASMEQGPNNVSSTKHEGDETEQNDEVIELEVDGKG